LLQENPGFNSTNVVVADIWLPEPNDSVHDPYRHIAQQIPFDREILRRIRSIPSVELAGITSDLPLTPVENSTGLTIEDMRADSPQKLSAEVIRVSPDYFRAIQTPLVRGRFFNEGDQDGALPVAIIDESTAQRYWSSRDPIGRRIRLGQDANLPWFSIVGIVKDIKYDGLDVNGVPHVYTSIYQRAGRILSLALRTSLPPPLLESQVLNEIHAVDPGRPVFGIRSMNELMETSLASRRFSAELVGAFAVLALLLASVGIHGLLAYWVGQRSQEIGVRIALGARRGHILKLILIQGGLMAGGGVCIGLILAAVTVPMIATVLYGIQVIDPLVFLVVPAILLLVSFAASYIPARRAARVSPMAALREG
jgi:putative ABC transport system permease protein